MNKHIFVFCCLTIQAEISTHGNGWSFEPPPRAAEPDTNKITQAILPPPGNENDTAALQELQNKTVGTLLDERLRYALRRFNPRQTVEHLAQETADEWLEERRIRDGKRATADGLKLAGREYAIREIGIRGFIGDMLGGKKIGTVRSSPFEPSEGALGWYASRISSRQSAWEGDIFRENPYGAFVKKGENWWGEHLWEIRTRVAFEDWQHPRLEAGGVFYLKPDIAFETGIQLRSKAERNGNSFGHGDDQRLAVFLGLTVESRYGDLSLGVSGLDTTRAFVAFGHRW